MAKSAKRVCYVTYLCALFFLAAWGSSHPVGGCEFVECHTEKEDCGWCGIEIEWQEPYEIVCCTEDCCTMCVEGICVHKQDGVTGCVPCDFNFVRQCNCACGPHPDCGG